MWPGSHPEEMQTWTGIFPEPRAFVCLAALGQENRVASCLTYNLLFLVSQLPLGIKSLGFSRLLCNGLKNPSQEVKRLVFRAGGTRRAALAMQSRSLAS